MRRIWNGSGIKLIIHPCIASFVIQNQNQRNMWLHEEEQKVGCINSNDLYI